MISGRGGSMMRGRIRPPRRVYLLFFFIFKHSPLSLIYPLPILSYVKHLVFIILHSCYNSSLTSIHDNSPRPRVRAKTNSKHAGTNFVKPYATYIPETPVNYPSSSSIDIRTKSLLRKQALSYTIESRDLKRNGLPTKSCRPSGPLSLQTSSALL